MDKQINNQYVEFIEKIIHKTKEHRIRWDYLDKNQDLYLGMDWLKVKSQMDNLFPQKDKYYYDFDEENSFYAKINDTYVVLRVRRANLPADLYVVPYTYKRVVKMAADEYGEHITRLMNLVQNEFPDGKSFIDKLLAEE